MKLQSQFSTFYIVRHGSTQWNEQGLIQGHKDSPLTSKGEEQAKILAKELQDIHFDLVFSSDLVRAKRTAEIVTLEKKLAIQTTHLLREKNFGIYEGLSYDALNTYNSLLEKLTEEKQHSFKADGVESYEEIVSRVIPFIRETAFTHPGKTILLTTHAGIMRTLLIHLGYGTYKNFPIYAIENAAYVKLETDGTDFKIIETKRILKPDRFLL